MRDYKGNSFNYFLNMRYLPVDQSRAERPERVKFDPKTTDYQ
ncbi:MAG: hypothetical protein OFPII_26460 [Osedax symbiont Rs1]|nr:MAG: hypothetical protein OFPII_26460 [Osedax symbiont Rs1]